MVTAVPLTSGCPRALGGGAGSEFESRGLRGHRGTQAVVLPNHRVGEWALQGWRGMRESTFWQSTDGTWRSDGASANRCDIDPFFLTFCCTGAAGVSPTPLQLRVRRGGATKAEKGRRGRSLGGLALRRRRRTGLTVSFHALGRSALL